MPYSCLLDRPAYLGVTVALFLWSEDFLKQHYLPVMRDHEGKFTWIPPPKHSSHVSQVKGIAKRNIASRSQHETIHPRQTVDYHGCYVFHGTVNNLTPTNNIYKLISHSSSSRTKSNNKCKSKPMARCCKASCQRRILSLNETWRAHETCTNVTRKEMEAVFRVTRKY